MTATTQEIISTMIDEFENYISEREHLFNYERSAPLLFEDEIAEIIRSVPDGTEITCIDANEITELFTVYNGENGIKIINMCSHSVPVDELIDTIYEYLETECKSVFVNDVFITEFDY